MTRATCGPPASPARLLRRELGDDALAVDAHPGPERDGRRPRCGHGGSQPDAGAAGDRRLGYGLAAWWNSL